jgi:hypothetical protein
MTNTPQILNSNIHKKNKPFLYIGLCLMMSYGLAFLLFLFKINFANQNQNQNSFLLNYFYVFIPLLAVIIVKNIIYKENFWQKYFYKFDLDTKIILIVFFVIFLELLVFLVSLTFPNITFSNNLNVLLQKYTYIFTPEKLAVLKKFSTDFSVDFFWAFNLFIGILVGCTTSAFFLFLEIIGWIGFLFDEYEYMGFWQASFYIGFWWGLFYTPFVFLGYFGNFDNSGMDKIIFAFILLVWFILLTPIVCLIKKKTQSLIYPAVFLGVLNSTFALATFFLVGASELFISFKGLAGLLVLLLVDIFLYLYDKNKINYKTEDTK